MMEMVVYLIGNQDKVGGVDEMWMIKFLKQVDCLAESGKVYY